MLRWTVSAPVYGPWCSHLRSAGSEASRDARTLPAAVPRSSSSLSGAAAASGPTPTLFALDGAREDAEAAACPSRRRLLPPLDALSPAAAAPPRRGLGSTSVAPPPDPSALRLRTYRGFGAVRWGGLPASPEDLAVGVAEAPLRGGCSAGSLAAPPEPRPSGISSMERSCSSFRMVRRASCESCCA